MFAKSVLALATVATFAVAAPVDKRGAPAGWAWGYLEDYDTYHTRYLALNCQNQHDTQFFDDCCHPLLATENLKDNRKAYCTPSSGAATSAAAVVSAQGSATPTASADVESESEYCESEPSAATPAAATPSAKTTTAAAAPAPSSKTTSSVGEEHYVAPTQAPTTAKTTQAPTTQAPTTQAPTTQAPTTQAPTTQAPAPTQKQSSGQFQGGYATYFYQGGNAGACGTVHGDYDMIVAIDKDQWGSSGYGSGSNTCGRWLTITNTNNGRSVTAMVADVCPTCANGNSLDLSVGAFKAIANESDGMVPISWSWN